VQITKYLRVEPASPQVRRCDWWESLLGNISGDQKGQVVLEVEEA
jgi:hypothetical protein